MRRLAVLAALIVSALAPATADAKTKRAFWFVNATATFKVYDFIGFTPVEGIQGAGQTTRYTAGSTTYVVTWTNSVASDHLRRALRNNARLGANNTVFSDRPLRKRERRRWRVGWDMARDADVLMVHPDNPVCANGVTKAQARGIARGEITSWSQLGGSGPIRRYLVGDPTDSAGAAFAEPRFGVKLRQPGSVVRADGGVPRIAEDPSVAAITSWSRVRRGSGACPVPVDGVKPSNASVHGLSYGPAYPVQWVKHRRRPRSKELRATLREYLRFLKSEKARAAFRAAGLLLADEPVPADGAGPGGGGGATGPPVRDDDGVRADLEGERFHTSSFVLAFDPAGAYTTVENPGDPAACTATPGSWTLLEGYRYSHDGGGTIATVELDGTTLSIRMPNADPSSAEVGGEPAVRDSSLPNSCP